MTEAENRATVLVVDDTEANLDILVDLLSDDYEVVVAMDGESALETLAEQRPDIILLDIMMPGMDGYEVCRRLKADKKTALIPVIFITAKTEAEDETKGFELGAVDYITKPISPPVVLARVATHLRLSRLTRRLASQNLQLKEYARLRDEVERMTQHDLKSPLTTVINVPELLLADAQLSDDEKELLQMVRESGHRMLHIVNSSLDMYKMETGRYQLNPEPVEALELVNQVKGELRGPLHEKGVDFLGLVGGRPAEAGDALWVRGEKMLLYSLLANLLKNAVEASPEGERLTVSLDSRDAAIIKIHNQGEVPRELKGRFFEKFATAGKRGGTGLGTYTAKLVADTLGGEIGMESSGAEGTTITVRLPLAAGGGDAAVAEPGSARAPAERVYGRGMSILVVDDYANMRNIIKTSLNRMGYNKILEAPNGEAALRLVAEKPVDLIISDMNMPKMSGVDLLGAIRSRPESADLPFIMVTGDANQDALRAAAAAKVSGYILKPFSVDTLETKINQVIFEAKNRA